MPGHFPPTLKLPSPSLNSDTSCEIASKHRCSLIYIDFNTSYQGIPICESFSHSAWVQPTSAKPSLHGCSPYMSSLLYAKLLNPTPCWCLSPHTGAQIPHIEPSWYGDPFILVCFWYPKSDLIHGHLFHSIEALTFCIRLYPHVDFVLPCLRLSSHVHCVWIPCHSA